MKIYFLLFVMVFSGFISNAQTSKGSIMLGGSIGYRSNNSKSSSNYSGNPESNTSSSTEFSIAPSFGYFIKDKLAVGISPEFQQRKNEYGSSNSNPITTSYVNKYSTQNISVNVFIRKYILLNPVFAFYAGIHSGGGPSKLKSENSSSYAPTNNEEHKGYSVNVGLNGGIAYFPDKRFGLHAGIGGLGWNYNERKNEKANNSSSNLNASLNTLTLNFGLYFFLGK